jgi:hypothetical protein
MGKRIIFLLILSLLILFIYPFAQRGFKVLVTTSEGASIPLYNQYRALVIGVSDYLYWPRLPNAVKDAQEVASALRELGFSTKVLENPSSEEIKKSLNSLVSQESGTEDGVLLYFAGHGDTVRLADGTELGYIVPKDCPLRSKDLNGFLSKSISMENIQTYSLLLKSKHLLAVFDSCFSGSIFALGRAAPEDISHKTTQPVRQYITAGSADETVPDESIFKDCFLEALTGDADANEDGYITGSELGIYLESKVVNYSRSAQHPQYGKIRNLKLDKGDFVFVLEKAKPAEEKIQLPPKPPETAGLDLTSIKKAEEERARIEEQWKAWQGKMRSDFNELEKMERSTGLGSEQKKALWQKYLDTYNADNPFSSEDEQLRQRARQRINELSEIEVKVQARVSFRAYGQSLSDSEVGAMLKRYNFFSTQYDWNKEFCNPSGDFSNSYESRVINGDKVVLDHATGLIWHQSGAEGYMTYSKAKQWVEDLNRRGYAGFYDWRLPTLEEGASLLEKTKMNGDLYIDPKFSVNQRWIWTSDAVTDYSSRVWVVDFIVGIVFRSNVDHYSGLCVRPVRSGQ